MLFQDPNCSPKQKVWAIDLRTYGVEAGYQLDAWDFNGRLADAAAVESMAAPNVPQIQHSDVVLR